jgi:threonylcarbamoyladenosine tRNA methylthiotransferase MtaB
LEPWGIPTGFFDLWQNPRLCRHLHLPLQSGCDTTLRRMIRRTSQREFRAVVQVARQAAPDIAIATDVIVGFPGETDEEFAISRDFIEEMAFADMHIFRYSQRPGTAAARMKDQVSEEAKHQRSDDLHILKNKCQERYARQFVGKAMPVLWEAVGGATQDGFINSGYTDNYLRVRSIVPDVLTNQISEASLVSYDAEAGLMHGLITTERVSNGR